ncbi:MAG: ubiquinone/menaquinone biosynthesis methyltransferase [Spirochaetaceae bacterium]
MDGDFRERLKDYNLSDAGRKREYNRRLFAVVAGRYDAVTTVLSFGRDRAWKRRLVNSLPKEGVYDALDIACGTGDLTYAVAAHAQNARLTGMDITPEMIRRARRLRGGSDARVTFELGDMSALPYGSERFDLVTGGYALRNSPDLDATIGEIHRVLRPRGSLGILEFSHADSPSLAAVQIGVLRLWGRLWGKLLHGNPEVYGYISESLKRFPSRKGLEEKLRRSGFREVRSRSFFLGLIAVTVARK